MNPLQGGVNELNQDDCFGNEVDYAPSAKRTCRKRDETCGS